MRKLVRLWKRPTHDGQKYAYYLIYYDLDGRRKQKALGHADNRRHRKRQKSIYRVCTREHISQRIAVDIQQDTHIDTQRHTTSTLHRSRANKGHKTDDKR